MKKKLVRGALVVTVGAVAVFVVLRLLSLSGNLSDAPAMQRPQMLAFAVAFHIAAVLGYAFLWRDIVCRLDRTRPPVIDSLAVFCASWLGRYVPSSLPYMAGKFAMGRRLGHGKAALGASMVYENALLCSVGAVIASIVIPLTLSGGRGGPLVYIAAGLGGVVALALLAPPVFHRLINGGLRLVRRNGISRQSVLSYRGILAGSLYAALALTLNGAGFTFVLYSFTDLSGTEMAATAAILVLSGVAGLVALPVPSGIGVREAVQIGLLQLFVPISVAAAAAVVARLIMIGVDLGFGLAGGALVALRRPVPSTQITPATQIE